MSRTVLVTGARGFIGRAVIRRLASEPGTSVVALARSRPVGAADQDVLWVESSLEDLTPSYRAIPRSAGFDAVVHLAAFTPKSARERNLAHRIVSANVLGFQRLLESLDPPPRRFVFASTIDVYAARAFEHAVTERSPVGPDGLYGLSKLFGEGLTAAYGESTGADHVTLRIGHVFGPGEEHYAKLVPETIRRVLSNQPPRLAGDGGIKRDLLYVDDAAEAIVRACTVPLQGTRTINVARGESHSVRDVIGAIADLAGYAGAPELLPAPADSHSNVFDTAVMRAVLGSWDFVPLAEGLKREIARVRSLLAAGADN